MNIKISLFLTGFLFCCSLFSRDIGSDICDNAGEVWNLNSKQLLEKYKNKKFFRWKSPLKRKMLYRNKSAEAELLFMDQRVTGGTFCFANNKKLRGVYLYLAVPSNINNKKDYDTFVTGIKKQMKQIGNFGSPQFRKRISGNNHRLTYSWKSRQYYASLTCNYAVNPKKFVPGKSKIYIFTRVSFANAVPKAKEQDETEETTGEALDALQGNKKEGPLEKNDKGDLSLKVRMVKAKQNSSSAASCLKSVLLFKEYPVKTLDWKRINERLDIKVTSANGATRIYARISQECNCEVNRLASSSVFDDYNTIMAFIRDYNSEAIKAGKSQISSFKNRYFSKLLTVMKEDVLVKVRNKDGEAEKFKSKVIKELEQGNPIIWVVFLGVVKEKPAPLISEGVHVRLITGFNPEENSLIYADCWGKGHYSKKMSWDKAWAITLEAMVATPKD